MSFIVISFALLALCCPFGCLVDPGFQNYFLWYLRYAIVWKVCMQCPSFSQNIQDGFGPYLQALGFTPEVVNDTELGSLDAVLGTVLYYNPPALGRDLAHIIITHPLSDIYAWSLMSATGHTSSEFTPGYSWPFWSAPHSLLSGWSSCQDPMFTVGPVILPGLHAWWCTIRVTAPNQEVGTTWASLSRTPHGAVHE